MWCHFLHIYTGFFFQMQKGIYYWYDNVTQPNLDPLTHLKVKVKLLSCVRLFVTPWTIAYQAPLPIGFSGQEYWSGLPFPSSGNLPDPGSNPGFDALRFRCFNLWAAKPCCWHWVVVKESSAFIAGYQARRTDSSCSEDLNSVMAFREGVLKAVWGRGPQSMWSAYAQFLDWLAWRWNLKHHQPFAFSQSRISALMVSSFYLVGVCFL